MRKLLLAGTGVLLLAGGGVALAQMPPPPAGPGPQDGATGPRERMEMRMMHMRPRAAGFRLRRGDAEIDIRCAPNEPMQACVNAAGTLIDKVAAMQQPRTQ